MNWTDLLREEMEYQYQVADRLMELVDQDRMEWKPSTGDNWMTVGQLLHHITTACGQSCKGFVTGDWGLPEDVDFSDLPAEQTMPTAENLPSVGSVGEARQLLAEDREVALAMVDEAGEADLAGRMMAAPWGDPNDKRPLGYHLLQMIQHLAQHKGQLFYYLELQGKPVDTSNLWGM